MDPNATLAQQLRIARKSVEEECALTRGEADRLAQLVIELHRL
jgi:hypothetical protein